MGKRTKRIKNDLIYVFIRALTTLTRRLPRDAALALCGGLGTVAYFLARDLRLKTRRNLTRVYGSKLNEQAIERLARQVFYDLGKNVVDFLRLPLITADNIDQLVRVNGLEHFEGAFAQGQGVIALSGHVGNFELLGAYWALKGYPLHPIHAPIYDSRLDALLLQNRLSTGLKPILRDRSIWAMSRVLQRGEILGILFDQDTDKVGGVFADFFGFPAYTPVGPVALAMKKGVPIVPMVIQRQPDDRHLITVSAPVTLVEGEDWSGALQENTARCNRALEQLIRQAPSQWIWMHERWRQTPPGEERWGDPTATQKIDIVNFEL